MSYDITKILELPADEQREIALSILENIGELNEEGNLSAEVEQELQRRFEKIEAGNYTSYTLEDVREKLAMKWQSK